MLKSLSFVNGKVRTSAPPWLHGAVTASLILAVLYLDLARPFGLSLSIFYILPALYAAWTLQGWIKHLSFAIVSTTLFLVPIVARPQTVTVERMLGRCYGVLVTLFMIHLVSERRRFIAALERANEELEERVAARTEELRKTNLILEQQVSERTLAEEALRKREEGFRALVEHAFEGINILNPQGAIVYASPVNAKLLDFEPAEIAGRSAFSFAHPDDQADLTATMRTVLANPQKVFGISCRLERKDGQWRWIEGKARNMLEHPAVRGIVVNWRDVTEHMQADKATRKSEEFFRLIWENSADGMRLTNEEGTVVRVNQAFCRMMGLPKETIEGKTLAISYARDRQDHIQEMHRQRFAARTVKPYLETEVPLRTGEKKWFAVANSFLEIDGEPPLLLGIFRDITERRRMEDALRESQQFNQQIIASAREGIVVYDRALRYQVWNPYMEEITGLPAETVVGKHALQLFPFLRANGIDALLERALAGETIEAPDISYVIPQTGQAGWSAARYGPLRDSRGQIIAAIGTVRDITERKRAEEAIRQSEERFRALAEKVQLIPWQADAGTGQMTYVGPQAAAILGYAVEDWYTPDFWQSQIHPGDVDWVVRFCVESSAVHDSYELEYRMIARDGRTVWLHDIVHVIRDPAGPRTLQGVLIDITERKRAEESLQERMRQQAAVAEIGQFALSTGDVDQLLSRAVTLVACTLEVELCKVLELLPDHSSLRMRAGVGWQAGLVGQATVPSDRNSQAGFTLLIDEPVIVGDLRTETRFQGPPLLFDHGVISGLSTKIVGPDGPFGVLGAHTTRPRSFTVDDVYFLQAVANVLASAVVRKQVEEERRKLEAQIQHAQKLESLGVLAGGIAHDFNNLLTGMLGYASLALMQLPDESPVVSMLREIERAAQRAADLTQQMLAYSGRGKFVIQPVRLDLLVQEMTKLLRTVVSRKVEIKLDLAPGTIEGDATQVRQVVMNLITNASDALEGAVGALEVRTGVRDADAADLRSPFFTEELPAGPYAYVEVEDNGCGMSKETLARIFDPFFTTKFTGRGLGLAAALGIVRGHRGVIKVASTPGQGTLFQVLFPCASAAPAENALDADFRAMPLRGHGTVLVVEDEPSLRNFAQRVLESAGFQVRVAGDGREGLEVLGQHRQEIDAVLLDLTMPRMDGMEMLRELRRLEPKMPVLVMSGYNDSEVATRFVGMGVSGFLQKPYHPRNLIALLCQLLPSEAARGCP